ncbi:MAG: clostripain-related cysteine peptidase [Planctomycetota bacterium]|nr:clostripain-related cysteine peptidase [Planctomycetota bacterium]MDW8372412.1 clostripain-related cysteine peptidase [Planctomycetota bacterium]
MMRVPLRALSAALVFVIAACGGGGGSQGGTATPAGSSGSSAGPTETWTLLVYGHADHNLSYSLARDLAEMGWARIGDHLRVLVVADWDAASGFPSGTEWLRVRGNGLLPERLELQGEQDFDDPVVLRRVAQRALTLYPAQRRGVILWDHGGAWEGGFGGDTQNQTREGRPMSAADAADALRTALGTAGIAAPLDFVAFDTCLMAGAEIAAEFADLATVYLACAELDFGDGWDYERTLTWLSANSAASARDFARAEVAHWDAHHQSDSDRLAKSHAAFDLTQWQAAANAIRELTTALRAAEGEERIAVARALYATVPGYGFYATDALEPRLRDLSRLSEGWAALGGSLAPRARAVREALERLRLAVAQGQIRGGQGGLHVEAALSYTYSDEAERLARYRQRAPRWCAASGWGDWLTLYASWNDQEPPDFDVSVSADGRRIEFSCADRDIADAAVWAERQVSSTQREDIGLVAYGLTGPGSRSFVWDGRAVALDDGQRSSFGSLWPIVIADDWSRMLLGLPAVVSDGFEELVGWVAFGALDTEAGIFIASDTSDILSVWRLQRGWKVTPWLWRSSGQGDGDWVPQTELTVPASARLALRRLPISGDLRLTVFGTDVWGNSEEQLLLPEVLVQRGRGQCATQYAALVRERPPQNALRR